MRQFIATLVAALCGLLVVNGDALGRGGRGGGGFRGGSGGFSRGGHAGFSAPHPSFRSGHSSFRTFNNRNFRSTGSNRNHPFVRSTGPKASSPFAHRGGKTKANPFRKAANPFAGSSVKKARGGFALTGGKASNPFKSSFKSSTFRPASLSAKSGSANPRGTFRPASLGAKSGKINSGGTAKATIRPASLTAKATAGGRTNHPVSLTGGHPGNTNRHPGLTANLKGQLQKLIHSNTLSAAQKKNLQQLMLTGKTGVKTRDLTLSEQTAIQGYLAANPNLDPNLQAVLTAAANNQPLTQAQLGYAIAALGHANLPPGVQQGLFQSVSDTILAQGGNGNSSLAGSLSGSGSMGGGGDSGGGGGYGGGGDSGGGGFGPPSGGDYGPAPAADNSGPASAGGNSGAAGSSASAERPSSDQGSGSTEQPGPVVSSTAQAPAQLPWQTASHLLVKNATDSKVTVWVQYYAENDKGEQHWYPGTPGESSDALTFTLDPGQALVVKDQDWTVAASRVRVWARAASGWTWLGYKDQDMWLVPNQTRDGRRGYPAADVATVTYQLRPQQ